MNMETPARLERSLLTQLTLDEIQNQFNVLSLREHALSVDIYKHRHCVSPRTGQLDVHEERFSSASLRPAYAEARHH